MKKIRKGLAVFAIALFAGLAIAVSQVGAQEMPKGVAKQGKVPGKGEHKGWTQGKHKGWDKKGTSVEVKKRHEGKEKKEGKEEKKEKEEKEEKE